LQYPVIHIVQWYTICSNLYDKYRCELSISVLQFVFCFLFFISLIQSIRTLQMWILFSRWNVFWVLGLASYIFLFIWFDRYFLLLLLLLCHCYFFLSFTRCIRILINCSLAYLFWCSLFYIDLYRYFFI